MRLRNLGFALALTLSWSTSACSTAEEPATEEAAEEEGAEEGEEEEAGEADEGEEAEEGEEAGDGEDAIEDADEICCEAGGKFMQTTRGKCNEHKGSVADDAKCADAAKPAPKRRKVEKPKK